MARPVPAWILRLLTMACVGMGACRTAAPALPSVEPVSHHATRVLFTVDVDDDVQVCADVNATMLFREPFQKGPVCGLTVGELRAWLQRLSRAD